jgi:hypothetical protein
MEKDYMNVIRNLIEAVLAVECERGLSVRENKYETNPIITEDGNLRSYHIDVKFEELTALNGGVDEQNNIKVPKTIITPLVNFYYTESPMI